MADYNTNIDIQTDSCFKSQVDMFLDEIDKPNKETVVAMLEAERTARDSSVKGYKILDELFADLKA